MNRRSPDHCGVCGLSPECLVRVHHRIPFIDGKCYDMMCFTCYSVPKKWEYDEKTNRVICYSNSSPYYLHSVQEMIEDGWTKSEAEFAIKAVKKLLINIPPIIIPFGGKYILECISLDNMPEIEIDGWSNGELKLKF